MDVVIIGGGPAGLLSAISSAKQSNNVISFTELFCFFIRKEI